jgi:hypothetical protein
MIIYDTIPVISPEIRALLVDINSCHDFQAFQDVWMKGGPEQRRLHEANRPPLSAIIPPPSSSIAKYAPKLPLSFTNSVDNSNLMEHFLKQELEYRTIPSTAGSHQINWTNIMDNVSDFEQDVLSDSSEDESFDYRSNSLTGKEKSKKKDVPPAEISKQLNHVPVVADDIPRASSSHRSRSILLSTIPRQSAVSNIAVGCGVVGDGNNLINSLEVIPQKENLRASAVPFTDISPVPNRSPPSSLIPNKSALDPEHLKTATVSTANPKNGEKVKVTKRKRLTEETVTNTAMINKKARKTGTEEVLNNQKQSLLSPIRNARPTSSYDEFTLDFSNMPSFLSPMKDDTSNMSLPFRDLHHTIDIPSDFSHHSSLEQTYSILMRDDIESQLMPPSSKHEETDSSPSSSQKSGLFASVMTNRS